MPNFVKNLSQKRILVPFIDRYLELGKFPPQWDMKIENYRPQDTFHPSFHPSGDCTPCVRELYAKFKGFYEKGKPLASTQKSYAVGNFWHIWLQTIIVDGLKFSTWDNVEKRLLKTTDLWHGTGTADILDCDIPGFGHYLIDFKTMNKIDFAKNEAELTHLVPKWRAQVNCYMDWGGSDRAIIVGIEKDSPHRFREFTFDRDETLVYTIHDKWTMVAESLNINIAPMECEHKGKCPADDAYSERG